MITDGATMTREEAYYERIKLLCGYQTSCEKWLNLYLEAEEPVSDIVLSLLDCQDDKRETAYRLKLYCLEEPFDKESVYVRLRSELWIAYRNHSMLKDDVINALFRYSQILPECTFSDQCTCLWNWYGLVEDGAVHMKYFDAAFEKWLKDGGEIKTDKMWSR